MQNQDSIEKVSRYLGNNVKVNLGGPESLPGRLLTVQSDYLALETKKDGVVYYPLRHVKSVSINSEDFSRSSRRMEHNFASNFHNVIRNLHHKKVKINRGGPESVQGVVSNVFDNHLELTVNNDIVFVAIYHVKSISQVGKDGRSSGNRSSGNRSSGNRNRSRSSNRNRSRSGNRTSGNRTSGNRSTSGRSTGNRSTGRTTGRTMTSRNDPRTSRVFAALAAAQQAGTDGFMFNDPTGSTGSSRRTSSCGSRSSRRSHRSRSTGSGRSHNNRRSRGSRSTGSGRSRNNRRSSRGSRRTRSGRSRNNRSSRGSGRSHHSRRRSSRGRNRRRSSGHHRRSRSNRSTGNTTSWNGMTVRRGGWIKLN